MVCWAISATGMTSSEPGALAIQVLWPSMYGSRRGRWMRWSESLRICAGVALEHQLDASAVSIAGSTSAPASRVGKK